jgi:hypothetical protein
MVICVIYCHKITYAAVVSYLDMLTRDDRRTLIDKYALADLQACPWGGAELTACNISSQGEAPPDHDSAAAVQNRQPSFTDNQ